MFNLILALCVCCNSLLQQSGATAGLFGVVYG